MSLMQLYALVGLLTYAYKLLVLLEYLFAGLSAISNDFNFSALESGPGVRHLILLFDGQCCAAPITSSSYLVKQKALTCNSKIRT